MSGLKRNWNGLPGRRSSPPPHKAPRLSPEPRPRRSPEAPWDILEDLERLSGHIPRQLLAFFERHEFQLAKALGSPVVAPGKVYTVLRAIRQVLEGPTEAQGAQTVLELVLQPAFLLQSLLGFIANLEAFRCEDGQISQEVMGDTVAALHHLLEASPSHAHSLLCYPVDLLCSTIQRLQSRGFQITWITQKRLWDTKSLLDKAFDHCGASGPVSPAGREDFHLIPVFPTPEDIFLEPPRKLKPNLISGRYKSDAEYLDTHFRLLREDLIKPLREGISSQFTLRSLYSDSQKPAGELRLYQNVQLVNVGTSPAGVTYLAKFRCTRSSAASSKRLLTGSLVCLISNNCDHVLFGTVARSNVCEVLRGNVWLDIQQGHSRLLKHLRRTGFTMVESPAFFEAYRHVLDGLQELDATCVPFRRYIVKCARDISRPSYLEGDMATFDIRALHPPRVKDVVAALAGEDNPEVEVPLVDLSAVSPQCAHLWTGEMFPHLDESQISAIRMALSTEFALIQGPPGTGKTFVGLKILEILLDNPSLWNKEHSPCLVVCYTNHALDQFLEGILRFRGSGVVRVGGRSRSEAVTACSLRNLRKRQLHGLLATRDKQQFGQMLQELRWQKESIAYCTEVLELLPKGVLTEQELRPEIRDDNLQIPEGGMLKWLSIYPPREAAQPPRRPSPSHSVRHRKAAAGSSASLGGHGPEFFQRHKDERFLDDDDEAEGEISPPSATPKSKFAYIVPAEESAHQRRLLAHLKERDVMAHEEAATIRDVLQLRQKDRWRLYRKWAATYENELKAALVEKLETYEKDAAQLEALSFQGDLKILRHSQVIGMTTTGAAKYRKLLQTVRPRIVIVEEAAEILEAHVLTSLTASCHHLILIGDHQQLRPKPADYTLEKKYGLGVSLFERMVNNQLPHLQLLYQHRMRPEISQLLVPCFYEELRDHSVVQAYESIKGVERSVFFVQHREEETHSAEAESYSNRHEAAFLVSLARYLLQQGYLQSQVTVLTPYHGQVMRIRALLQQEGLEEVAAHAVDDFQGEENDIVLLSLVRSNRKGKVGFLKDKNRLCVALSRAKKGFYCIGNLEHLSASHRLWKELVGSLRAKRLLGEELTLMCQNHPDTKTAVKDGGGFRQLPDGGCTLQCQARLACGHPCTRRCHPCDTEHRLNVCRFPCSKDLCELRHRCPKKCNEPCGPCQVPVEKVIPKCGHSQTVPCHVPATSWICEEPCQELLGCGHPCKLPCGKDCRAVLCKETVQVPLPCAHTTEAECFMRNMALPCRVKCLQSLACGHGCEGSCSECVQGRIHAACRRKCSRVLLCSHVCQGSCSESCPPCERPCPSQCPHSRCSKKCGEACFPCTQPCAWRCEHHQCTRTCSEICNRPRCDEPCPKTLKCKHPCVGLCGEPCPPKCRTCRQEELAEIFFGSEDEPDSRFVVLVGCGHIFEVGGLDQWMDGEAGQARARHVQQKVCPKCSTPIQSNPRYNNVIKATQQSIEEIKRKIRGSKEELRAGQAALLGRLMAVPHASRYFQQAALMRKIEAADSLQSLRDWENTVNFLLCIQKLKRQAEKCTAERKGRLVEAAEGVESWVCRRRRADTFTAQQLRECRNEIKRISYLANIFERLSSCEKNQAPSSTACLAVVEKVVSILNAKAPFTEAYEELLQPMLETIEQLLPASGTRLPQAERVSIMEAMRFGRGRWYTCLNGHLYTVGQCGRPMEESRCPECRSAIGGQHHKANPGNRTVDDPMLDPGDGAEDRRRLSDITEPAGPSDYLAFTAASPPCAPGSPSHANDSCTEAGSSPGSPTYPPPSSCQVEPHGTWEECSPTASPRTCRGQEARAPSPSPEDAKAAAVEDMPLLGPLMLQLEEEGERRLVVPQPEPEPGGEPEDSAGGSVSQPREPGTSDNPTPGIPQLSEAGSSPGSPTYPPPSSCQVEPHGTWEECSPTASPRTRRKDTKAAAVEVTPLLGPLMLHLEEDSSLEEEGERRLVVPQPEPEPGGEPEDSAGGSVSQPREPGTSDNLIPAIPQLSEAGSSPGSPTYPPPAPAKLSCMGPGRSAAPLQAPGHVGARRRAPSPEDAKAAATEDTPLLGPLMFHLEEDSSLEEEGERRLVVPQPEPGGEPEDSAGGSVSQPREPGTSDNPTPAILQLSEAGSSPGSPTYPPPSSCQVESHGTWEECSPRTRRGQEARAPSPSPEDAKAAAAEDTPLLGPLMLQLEGEGERRLGVPQPEPGGEPEDSAGGSVSQPREPGTSDNLIPAILQLSEAGSSPGSPTYPPPSSCQVESHGTWEECSPRTRRGQEARAPSPSPEDTKAAAAEDTPLLGPLMLQLEGEGERRLGVPQPEPGGEPEDSAGGSVSQPREPGTSDNLIPAILQLSEAGSSPGSPTYPPPSSCQVEPHGTWEECSPTASPRTRRGQEARAPSPSPEDAKAAAVEDTPLLGPLMLQLEEEGERRLGVPQPEPGGEPEDSAGGSVSQPREPGTSDNPTPGIPQLPEAELDIIHPVQRRRSRRLEQKKRQTHAQH